MSKLAFLLQDVFAFLSVLAADDVHPLGSRYLPPSALARLNTLLLVPDHLPIQHLRNAQGRWSRNVRLRVSERRTERIRFLHYLAESAGLVAVAGDFLKPTPGVARWLNMSNSARAPLLFRSGFPARPAPEDGQRWCAFKLPGSALPAPLSSLNQLLLLLRQAQADEYIKVRTLSRLLALPIFEDDAPEHQPSTVLRGWLDLLDWFELIAWTNASTLQLTPVGTALLQNVDMPSLADPCPSEPLHWAKAEGHAIPELVASLDADLAVLWELGQFAVPLTTLASGRQMRRFTNWTRPAYARRWTAAKPFNTCMNFWSE